MGILILITILEACDNDASEINSELLNRRTIHSKIIDSSYINRNRELEKILYESRVQRIYTDSFLIEWNNFMEYACQCNKYMYDLNDLRTAEKYIDSMEMSSRKMDYYANWRQFLKLQE